MVDHDAVRWQHGYHPLTVKEIRQETADTRSYVLDVTDELAEVFDYRAGQFCTFRVHLGDDEHLRSYSMSSAPETDADLTVTVKRVPGGLISNWFHDHVDVGDVLELTKPAGVFCLRDEAERPVLAYCGGSGVTPVMSIAKSVLAGTTRSVRLLYANRDEASVIFRDELNRLVAEHADRLEVRYHLDADAGLLDADAIAAFLAETPDADVYICGPEPFMDLVEGTLTASGVTPDRIAIERFVNAGQHVSSTTPPAVDAEPAEDAAPVEAPAGATETVTIILKGQRHEVAYRAGDTLLETARRGGLQAPFSCEAGNCATCMALVIDGSASMRTNNALTADEVAEGWVLTCQALPEGQAVTVEYESF